MKIIYLLFFNWCFLLHTNFLFSQNVTKDKLNAAIKNDQAKAVSNDKQIIDSLLQEINKTKSDTTKIKLYLRVCDLCDLSDNLKYAKPVINIIDKLLPLTKDSLRRKRLMQWRFQGSFQIF